MCDEEDDRYNGVLIEYCPVCSKRLPITQFEAGFFPCPDCESALAEKNLVKIAMSFSPRLASDLPPKEKAIRENDLAMYEQYLRGTGWQGRINDRGRYDFRKGWEFMLERLKRAAAVLEQTRKRQTK